MIEVRERGFEDGERRALDQERRDLLRRKRRFDRFVVISVVVVLAAGIPLALGQGRQDPGLGILAFATVAAYVIIVLVVYLREGAGFRQRLATLDGMAGGGRVRVTRCRAERVVAMEEIEDEGPEYFFEVEPSRVYYVGGQQYDLGTGFPNSDFEIVEGHDAAGRPVFFEVRCHGAPLRPVRTIPAAVKLDMLAGERYPGDGDLLECALDDVETHILKEG